MDLFGSKYRDMAESLSEQLVEANTALAMERQKRFEAETLATERKIENERLAQALERSEAAREKALEAMNGINAKLLQAVLPQAEPLWKKAQPTSEQSVQPMPLMQPRRARQPNEADRLFAQMQKMHSDQQRMKQATAMAEANRLPGTKPTSGTGPLQ